MKNIRLEISDLANGGIQEKVDYELKEVIENLLDLNTDPGAKRKITVEITMTTNDKRDVVDMVVQAKSKLAMQNSVSTTVLVGRDMDTGAIQAAELVSLVPGQTFLDPNDDFKQKTDIGTSIDEIEKTEQVETPVLDFQKKQQNNA